MEKKFTYGDSEFFQINQIDRLTGDKFMRALTTLDTLSAGQKARITAININGSMRKRLQELGLIEETDTQCLFISPGGDPLAYLIRGAVIAIRTEDASRISCYIYD